MEGESDKTTLNSNNDIIYTYIHYNVHFQLLASRDTFVGDIGEFVPQNCHVDR